MDQHESRVLFYNLLVYILVVFGSCIALGGLVRARNNSDSFKDCLLFAELNKTPQKLGVEASCQYALFAAAVEFIFGVFLAVWMIVRALKKTTAQLQVIIVELIVASLAFIISITSASVTTTGFAKFCFNLPNEYTSCRSFFHNLSHDFYTDFDFAQVGLWLTTAWASHVFMSAMVIYKRKMGFYAVTPAGEITQMSTSD